MSADVVTLGRNNKLAAAEDLMRLGRIRHLPVVDEDGGLAGIVSQRDLFHSGLIKALGLRRAAQHHALATVAIKEAMNTKSSPPPETSRRRWTMSELPRFGCLVVVKAGAGSRISRRATSSACRAPSETHRAGMPVAGSPVMQTPLRLVFHRMPPSPALEARIRRLAKELELVFDGIVSCRVSIEAPHRHHHQGQLYRVGIEIGVPGGRIVVGRSPDEHAANADAHVAVRNAFRAARRRLTMRRRLDEYVRRASPSLATILLEARS